MKYTATLIGLLLMFPSFVSAQQLYKWRDEKGQWHFGNAPGEVGNKAQVGREINPLTRERLEQEERLKRQRQEQEERQPREAQVKERETQEQKKKQLEALARERSLNECLAQADAEYQDNWVRTCAIVEGRPLGPDGRPVGVYQGCASLPFPQADSLTRDRRAARDECYKRYPQQ